MLSNFSSLEKGLMENVEDVLTQGIRYIAKLVDSNASFSLTNLPKVIPPTHMISATDALTRTLTYDTQSTTTESVFTHFPTTISSIATPTSTYDTQSTTTESVFTHFPTTISSIATPTSTYDTRSTTTESVFTRLSTTISSIATPTSEPEPQPGLDPNNPADSCYSIMKDDPSIPSGEYWVTNSDKVAINVFCELQKEEVKGMMRVANVDMRETDSSCPSGLALLTTPKRTCRRLSTTGCSSAFFSTTGITYSKVCGRIRGYQYASPNAFYWFQSNRDYTIDDLYVDGVVLSYSNNGRQHIWTFAAAIDEVKRGVPFACQCTNTDDQLNFQLPSFVGNDYFCETGTRGTFSYNTFYEDDPLWDGKGCGDVSTCCDKGEWFCKDLDITTSSDVELQLCGNENRSNEDTPLEIIELYVQ